MIGQVIGTIGILLFGFLKRDPKRDPYYKLMFLGIFIFSIFASLLNLSWNFFIGIAYLICFFFVVFLEYIITQIYSWRNLREVRNV